jgi:hypothetical protein
MSWSDLQVTEFFGDLPNPLYLSLHYYNPAMGGVGSAEFSGGSYLRQSLTFSAPSNRSIYNTNPVTFNNLLASQLAYLGLWDAATAGNLVATIPVLPVLTINSGGNFPVNVGDVVLSF